MISANRKSRILVMANFFTENNHELFQITHLGPKSNVAILPLLLSVVGCLLCFLIEQQRTGLQTSGANRPDPQLLGKKVGIFAEDVGG